MGLRSIGDEAEQLAVFECDQDASFTIDGRSAFHGIGRQRLDPGIRSFANLDGGQEGCGRIVIRVSCRQESIARHDEAGKTAVLLVLPQRLGFARTLPAPSLCGSCAAGRRFVGRCGRERQIPEGAALVAGLVSQHRTVTAVNAQRNVLAVRGVVRIERGLVLRKDLGLRFIQAGQCFQVVPSRFVDSASQKVQFAVDESQIALQADAAIDLRCQCFRIACCRP